jgi:hypothetical protein
MTELILKGSEKKITLLKNLAGEMGLDYRVVKKRLSRRQAKLATNIKEALKEVERAEKGKIKLKSFDEFLNEL